MPRRRRKRKVVRVNSRRPINIDKVFFGAVAVYMCVICYMALTSVHIAGYEVQAGTLAVNHTYKGFAVRQETVCTADTSGYVSFYASAGDRVSGSSLVYTIDEKGEINDLIRENADTVDLTDDNFSQIRGDMKSFMDSYDDTQFGDVYEFQSNMESMVMELVNQSMLDSLAEAGDDSMFSRVYASGNGILEFYQDGYEDVTVESMTEDMLDPSTYTKQSLKNEMVQAGEPIYKLSTSEKWSMVVPLSEEEATGFINDGTDYMQIRFTRDDTKTWAKFSIVYVGSTPCARLDFNTSMVRFADLRYIEVEFMIDDQQGLKIPNTAIVEKEFYLIPKAYLVEQDGDQGFMKEIYDKDGGASVEFLKMTIYYEDDDYYYIDPMESDYTTGNTKLPIGTYLVQPDSQERVQVGNTGVLKGVYNINKGYTQFRQINILYQNEEYALVEQGTSYGLTVYDHIVLNGSAVDEDQIIY